MTPDLYNEIDEIMQENKYEGQGAQALAQKRVVEYCKVGRDIERMYSKMTLGLYKDRRTPKEIMGDTDG